MRSESELMNDAKMFDFQKDSPFQMPDENILMPTDLFKAAESFGIGRVLVGVGNRLSRRYAGSVTR